MKSIKTAALLLVVEGLQVQQKSEWKFKQKNVCMLVTATRLLSVFRTGTSIVRNSISAATSTRNRRGQITNQYSTCKVHTNIRQYGTTWLPARFSPT